MRKTIISILVALSLTIGGFLCGVHYTATHAELSVLHNMFRMEILGQVYLHQGQ